METCIWKERRGELSGTYFLASGDKKLGVTIGIPAYNERGRIGCLLRQVLHQNGFQVDKIIVNTSGSTDGTQDEVIATIKHCKVLSLIKIIDKRERTGKAAALDEILKACDSDIVIFVDGDVKLHEGCFKEILKPFLLDSSIGVVSGNVMPLNGNKEGLFSFISRLERQLHHELCMDLMRKKEAPKVNGTFFTVRKNVISHLPYHTVSDDEYISCCAQRKGSRVVYAPNAIVYTKDPENCKDYIAKRRRIFSGHLLIKKSMGYTVPTTRVSEIIPSLLKFLIREKRRILDMFVMLYLQCISYMLAIFDVVTGDIPYCYRVESGKF
jgi:cellulose synthase/poly-beta-1,6-N-acetylglucosamine synthase-like glycosyltransferase